ncbi:MAG: purine-nucleoside phosphorylase [bacterium]|nr:purine-nucleoside phosphorylase [bacterium]
MDIPVHQDIKPIIEVIQSEYHTKNKTEIPKYEIGIILGSGLGILSEKIINPTVIETKHLPNYPISTVAGHAGKIVLGELSQRKVIVFSGRIHYYEGYTPQQVVLPVRIMKALGVKGMIVTNAAGGVREDLRPGTFMRITDHINLMGMNPLRGLHQNELGPRFPDLTSAYTPEWGEVADQVAKKQNIPLKKGILGALSGPTYETPAEVRMWRILGVSAVCMSTVPEVIVAAAMNLKVLGISCITNVAAGLSNKPLDHSEVTEIANQVREPFIQLITAILTELE